MKQICSPKHCTGCGACVNACPKQCIHLDYDNDGFLQPRIDKQQCIDCGKCEKVCPDRAAVKRSTPTQAIVACSQNGETVRASSSGGIFSELAEKVFDIGGVVFGAVFTEDFSSVQHTVANAPEELSKMRGSKYIQSNTLNTYSEAKKQLLAGKTVLFSGTPCQIAGLKSYLGKEYESLITLDFICHGVASTKAYCEYLSSLGKKEELCGVTFRYKKTADVLYANSTFKAAFADGACFEKVWFSTSFGYGFANNLLSRPSCSSCRYATLSRTSDITVADYISEIEDESLRNTSCAKSLILINTPKGADLFEKAKNSLLYSEISVAKAASVSKHLSSPAVQHRNRRKFFKHLGECSWDELSKKYFTVYKPRRSFKNITNKLKIFK